MAMRKASSSASSSSIGCLSSDSVSSNMAEDRDDDDVSSFSANGFELSDLISQLPIKRGLSRYYDGKSNSFKNLTSAKSLEDVPKMIRSGPRGSGLYGCRLKKKVRHNRNEKEYYTTPKSKISKSKKRA